MLCAFATTAAFAIGMPVAAAAWVHARTDDVAAHLSRAAGERAEIGGIDADLTGRVRLTDVALGSLVAADAIEASVALDSLLSGHFGADEIRVARPRIAIDVSPDGDSDLARVVRRLAKPASKPTAGSTKLRRVVVSSGSLIARVAGIGDFEAEGVELVPDEAGVRVLTGALRLRGAVGDIHGETGLARAAADVALPHVSLGRVLAVAGEGTTTAPAGSLAVHEVAIGRLVQHGPLEL